MHGLCCFATKAKFLAVFISFLNKLKSFLKVLLGLLQSDQGGEFMETAFCAALVRQGVALHVTAVGSPKSNGLAERTQGVVQSMAWTAMMAACVPVALWPEAIATAMYVQNRIPALGVANVMLHELLLGPLPDVSNLQVWGSIGMALWSLANPTTKEHCARGLVVRLVGYGDQLPWKSVDGYRVWDGCCIWRTCNVRFAEGALLGDAR